MPSRNSMLWICSEFWWPNSWTGPGCRACEDWLVTLSWYSSDWHYPNLHFSGMSLKKTCSVSRHIPSPTCCEGPCGAVCEELRPSCRPPTHRLQVFQMQKCNDNNNLCTPQRPTECCLRNLQLKSRRFQAPDSLPCPSMWWLTLGSRPHSTAVGSRLEWLSSVSVGSTSKIAEELGNLRKNSFTYPFFAKCLLEFEKSLPVSWRQSEITHTSDECEHSKASK